MCWKVNRFVLLTKYTVNITSSLLSRDRPRDVGEITLSYNNLLCCSMNIRPWWHRASLYCRSTNIIQYVIRPRLITYEYLVYANFSERLFSSFCSAFGMRDERTSLKYRKNATISFYIITSLIRMSCAIVYPHATYIWMHTLYIVSFTLIRCRFNQITLNAQIIVTRRQKSSNRIETLNHVSQ